MIETASGWVVSPLGVFVPPAYRERACAHKRAYATKASAKRHARMTSARFGGEPKVAYRCRWCDAWHVGRDPR